MTDYYLDSLNCYKRLKAEYQKYNKIIIACDFDDTIFDFHGNGWEYPDVINLLKRWRPYAEIIIWSGHTEEQYPVIQKRLDEIGLEVDGINIDSSAGVFGRKIYANVFLDDRSGLHETYMILYRLITDIENGEV